nr:MAG TPA: hypothetical protein [Caudoviricetes sp.]
MSTAMQTLLHHSTTQRLQSRCLHVCIRLYASAVDVYRLRCLSHFNDCGF